MLSIRTYTAKVSFGLYLWHYVVVNIAFSPLLGLPIQNGIVHLQTWLIISIVMTAISYLIATLSYYLVEKPVMDWAQRVLKKESVIPPLAPTFHS